MSVINQFQSFLQDDAVLTGEQVSQRISHIWSPNEPLKAKVLLRPQSTEEVSKICRICFENNQPIVTHGGLTNLVASTTSTPDDVVISMERMNSIEEIDEVNRTATVQAGVILQNIHDTVDEKGLLFPLTLGAKGSCQIGGNIATNAGGLQVIRYGMTRSLVLGLEVVLADGTIINSMKKIIKDNSGYDLKQIFIGSEGTLGIITRAVLKLKELPKSRNTAFIGVSTFDQVARLLKFLDQELAGTLSAFEILWDDFYLAMTSEPVPFKPPIPHGFAFYVLAESLGTDPDIDRKRFHELMEQALEKGLMDDAAIAYNQTDYQWFWNIREDVGMILQLSNFQITFDISLPIDKMEGYIARARKGILVLEGVSNMLTFGHIGDGNLHVVVLMNDNQIEVRRKIQQYLYEPLKAINGSVSAEHGIGIDKKRWLPFSRSPEEIALMKTIKKALDPRGIMNPGKIF